MSKRIDHVARALAYDYDVEQYENDWHSIRSSPTPSTAMVGYTMDAANIAGVRAQIHATLALVEQQRIANLIALAHVADTSDTAVSPMEMQAWTALGTTGDGKLRTDIREALGI